MMNKYKIGAIVVAVIIIVAVIVVVRWMSRPKMGTNLGTANDQIDEEIIMDNMKTDVNTGDDSTDSDSMVDSSTGAPLSKDVVVDETMFGIFESESEAEKTAELYGIVMISYNEGVAVFQLQNWQTPADIIQAGKDNGWPALEVNSKRELY